MSFPTICPSSSIAAYDQGDTAVNLLSSHREDSVLRSALLSANSPYHHIVAAVVRLFQRSTWKPRNDSKTLPKDPRRTRRNN